MTTFRTAKVRTMLAGSAAALLLSGCAAAVTGAAVPAADGLAAADRAAVAASSAAEPGAAAAPTEDPADPTPADAPDRTEDPDPSADPDPTDEEPVAGDPVDVEAFAADLWAANVAITSARGTMAMDMAGIEVDATMEMTMAEGETAAMTMVMQMDVPTVPQPVEMKMLMADETFYLGGDSYLELLGLGIPAGKWVLLDPSASDRNLAAMAKEMEASMRMQGMVQVTTMVEMAESIEFVGAEDLDGQPSKHYRLMLDGEKALELGAGAAGQQLPAGVEIGLMPMDLWLDEQGRTSRTDLSMDVAGQSVEMSMSFHDFDAPLVIEAPAADDVVELD